MWRQGGRLPGVKIRTHRIHPGGGGGVSGGWLGLDDYGWDGLPYREGTGLGRLLGLYGHNTFINSETYGQQDQTNNTPPLLR